MPIPFREYAVLYDLIYADKNYGAEAAFIAGLTNRFLSPRTPPITILDLACGTGRHALELARLGYHVEGSDISVEMIQIARHSARKAGLPLRFHTESFQTCSNISGPFDVVLAMFASLGYLTSWNDLRLAFHNVSSLLKTNGLFIFDVWNGNAVLRDFVPHRTKLVNGHGLDVKRISRTDIDEIRQLADIRFDFEVRREDGTMSKFEERHLVRYFFPQDLTDMLTALGFQVVFRCPFLEPDRDLRPRDWNMTYVSMPTLSR